MSDFGTVYAAAYADACARRNNLIGQTLGVCHEEALAAVVNAAKAEAVAPAPELTDAGTVHGENPACANTGCPAPPANNQVYCAVDCAWEDAYRPLPEN